MKKIEINGKKKGIIAAIIATIVAIIAAIFAVKRKGSNAAPIDQDDIDDIDLAADDDENEENNE